jgi:hypothetical protein
MDRYTVNQSSTEQKPYHPYRSVKDAPTFKSTHLGQRKLLAMEIMFLTMHGFSPNRRTVVIYAGAAPADHTAFLSTLFPSVFFVLVDPEKWNADFATAHPSLGHSTSSTTPLPIFAISPQIQVHHGYFTDDLAHSLGTLYKDDNVLFISDIRPTNIEEVASSIQERNDIVDENMSMQKRWYTILNSKRTNNVWAMFKFKADFERSVTTYLDGALFVQPWAPLRSPELRLITNVEGSKVYDNKWLEQYCIWFNEVKRNDVSGSRDPRLNNLVDTLFEHDICHMYLSNLVLPGVAQTPFELMGMISQELGNKDVSDGLRCFEAGYVPNAARQTKLIQSIVVKDKKYAGQAI